MRTFLLLLVTCVVLAGAYAVYWKLQPATPIGTMGKTGTVTLPPLKPGGEHLRGIQSGTGVWLKEFDEVTGELRRQFRSDEYVPQKNGTVRVKNPEVWFYGSNQQKIHITGTDGEIVVKDAPDLTAKSRDNSPPAPPSRGRLHIVTVSMFSASSAPGEADEVLTADNIQFDNDTLLITTESFVDAAGQPVAPDQVPVQVRGKYDFDGRGLKMRWNDKDGRLDMLEIAHGEQLTIKDTAGFSRPDAGGARPGPASLPSAALPSTALPVMLAARDKSAAGAAIQSANRPASTRPPRPARPRAEAPAGPPQYLVTFNDEVNITQGDTLLAMADRMEIDFLTKQDPPRATTAPAAGIAPSTPAPSTSAPSTSTPSTSVPSPRSSAAAATLPDSSKGPATRPATRPAEPPLVVRWTGKLTIVPTPAARRMPMVGGDAILSLTGRPVTIVRTNPQQQKRQEIRAATAVYYTNDRSISLGRSAETPDVVMKEFSQENPEPTSTIVTGSLDYLAGQHVANLGGTGHVLVPADANAPDKGSLDVRWSRGGRAYLIGGAIGDSGEMSIERMDLSGKVDVEHPQLSMQSEELSLFFDPADAPAMRPAGRPAQSDGTAIQLRRVLATTAVHCLLTDAQGRKQTIEGQELELLTQRGPDGQMRPRQVNAAGGVHAFDEQQDLRSTRLQITLRPATASNPGAAAKPPATQRTDGKAASSEMELERMLATGQVIASSKDGSVATGDELEVVTIDGEQHVRLSSSAGVAKLTDAKKNVIAGPTITARPKQQLAHIEGAGSVGAIMADPDGSRPRPVSVAWQDHADFSGGTNSIDAVGQIAFNTVDTDGTRVESHGDRVHVDLEEKPPATQPAASRPARDSGPQTRAAKSAGAADAIKMDPMGQKQVKAVTLDGNAQVVSTLSDEQGNVLVQRAMQGPRIIYQSTGSAQQPARSVTVPAAGRMLMSDHRLPDKRANADAGSGFDSGRGDTAFQWKQQFLYSETQHRATMTGDVLIAYKGLGDREQPVYINAAVVTAEFEPAREKPSTRPAAPPATRPADANASLQVRRVVADGDAQNDAIVRRAGSALSAMQISFDPATHRIIAKGTRSHPAVFTRAEGTGTTSAEQLEWNTVTWDISVRNANVRGTGR